MAAINISTAMFATPLLILISLAIIHNAESDQMVITTTVLSGCSESIVESPLPQKIDCDGACEARCEKSSRPRLCKRACGTCCERCDCVPPGTSGNYDACPCYANMTTHGGRHKCP
ncbi:Gibberellin regulated protein [Parasponia andersonii]|uniref:Gibberellin regulated protein n=1 Tax=Parasponia andersonii TaxID=3476 RepID=A0A2P5DBT3_PARAD|nr:Gibberellin regulated protein [Parasponia andersonii]